MSSLSSISEELREINGQISDIFRALSYATNLENKRVDLFEGPGEGVGEDNVLLASAMTNDQLIDRGNRMMDETDQAIDRGKKIVHETIGIGQETAEALKAQTEQMSRIVKELDSINFSIKKASKQVKDIDRQIVNPHNKDIQDIPGLAPPAQSRRLLWFP